MEVVTVSWMTLEAVVAIGAGLAARSVLLTAFGADSVIELLSGLTLLWRLHVETRSGDLARVEDAERTGVRISALLLGLLSLYVLAASAAGLVLTVRPDPSWLGVAVSASALGLMPLLVWRKRQVNQVLRSAALRADIAESACCAYLALITLLGIATATATGWWWVQYVAALALLRWLLPETIATIRAAHEGRTYCECD